MSVRDLALGRVARVGRVVREHRRHFLSGSLWQCSSADTWDTFQNEFLYERVQLTERTSTPHELSSLLPFLHGRTDVRNPRISSRIPHVCSSSRMPHVCTLSRVSVLRLELAAVGDHDGLGALAGLGAHSLDGLHDVEAVNNAAEHDVLAVEPAHSAVILWFASAQAHERTMAFSNQSVLTVQRKNWEPLVLGPALAMDKMPGPSCLSLLCMTSSVKLFARTTGQHNQSRQRKIDTRPGCPGSHKFSSSNLLP